ncbi:MAG TPA: hypothetical protein PLG43_03675 [Spirochaetia bacterium]|nr:hypothetical protein [Spirochaetia bacterium]
MKKKVERVSAICLLALILASCQQVFTYSPLAVFQRDPADVMAGMTTEQKAAYAQSLLDRQADPQDLAVAYDEIASVAGTDPELNLLAANLAIGAGGLGEAVDSILETVGEGGEVDFTSILGSLDMTMLANVPDHFEVAVASGADIDPNEYINASAALIITLATDSNLDGIPDDFSHTFDSIDWDTVLAATPESLPFPGAASGSVEEALNWAVMGGMAQFVNDYFVPAP